MFRSDAGTLDGALAGVAVRSLEGSPSATTSTPAPTRRPLSDQGGNLRTI